MYNLSRKYFPFIFIIILSLNNNFCFSQVPTLWFFGQKAGLYYDNIAKNIVNVPGSSMNTPEGCATYGGSVSSDYLYTNGEKIWNKSGSVIRHGENLSGSIYSCQSSLFYKPPKSSTILLFTTDSYKGKNGLCYNKVFLQNTNSKVTEKNVSLLPTATERMTTAIHCNKKSAWLVCHEWNSDAFYSYCIEQSGEILKPVISNIGSIHNGDKLNAKGCMKISLDATKLALVKMADGVLELFHFDYITGKVSDPITIENIKNAYGVEFDYNGNVLYVSSASGVLYQFSLHDWDKKSIEDSKQIIVSKTKLIGSLQIHADRKIYVSEDHSYYLSRIEKPDVLGKGCLYEQDAIYLDGKLTEAGLPQVYIPQNPYELINVINCLGDTSYFSITGDTTDLDSVKWYFGKDPYIDSSFSYNSSHLFNSIGTHDVTLLLYHCDTIDTLDGFARIIGPPFANLGNDTSFCENSSRILNPGGGDSFLWNDMSTSPTLYVDKPGIYWVNVKNSCGEHSDTIEIFDIFPKPKVSLPSDSSICFGDSVLLEYNDTNLLCIWQNTDTSKQYIAKQSGSYLLLVVDSNNCTNSDIFNLEVIKIPSINLGNDTSICHNSELYFNGTADGFYFWQNGSTSNSMTMKETGLYHVTVSNKCGTSSDSIYVNSIYCEQIIWTPNAFTPNKDGKNDVFLPYVENVEYFKLHIFSRWGTLLFETEDINEGWNGEYKGKNCAPDTYIWRIDYINFSGKKFNQYGFVILVN